MKKIVGTIAAIALAASSAFAGVNVGMGFNRALFTPFAIGTADGSKAEMSTCVSWGGAPRVGVSFSAAGDQIGVVGDIKLDGNAVAVNDNAYVWVKPTSWFKMQIGQSFDDTLRGGMCWGIWDWLRCWGAGMTGDDLTFTRISGDSALSNKLNGEKSGRGGDVSTALVGAILMLDPIEGLHIGVGIKTGFIAENGTASYGAANTEDIFKHLQVQAGYTIADVVQIKAQWIGYADTENDAQGVINAAVGFKMVENMNLEVGAFFDTAKDSNMVFSAFFAMPVGPVGLNANAKLTIPTADGVKGSLDAGIGASFDCGNGLSVAADLRAAISFADGVDPALAFGLFADKWLGNGSLGIGFEGAVNTASIAGTNCAGDFKMAVPVRVQCFF